MSKHLVFAATLTALTLIGFGSIASAAYADAPSVCWQPGSNPPIIVDCASPAATTPYTAPPTTVSVTTVPANPNGVGTPSNPFADGTCWQPGSNPPVKVDCKTPAATTPYVPAPTTLPAGVATTVTDVAQVELVVTAAPETSPARVFVAQRHLPATGAPTTILVIVGGFALLVGAALLLAGRRVAV